MTLVSLFWTVKSDQRKERNKRTQNLIILTSHQSQIWVNQVQSWQCNKNCNKSFRQVAQNQKMMSMILRLMKMVFICRNRLMIIAQNQFLWLTENMKKFSVNLKLNAEHISSASNKWNFTLNVFKKNSTKPKKITKSLKSQANHLKWNLKKKPKILFKSKRTLNKSLTLKPKNSSNLRRREKVFKMNLRQKRIATSKKSNCSKENLIRVLSRIGKWLLINPRWLPTLLDLRLCKEMETVEVHLA